MGWFLNGRVSAVVGTHTHVPTADERILDGGTAYITDLGMTGSYFRRNRDEKRSRFREIYKIPSKACKSQQGQCLGLFYSCRDR